MRVGSQPAVFGFGFGHVAYPHGCQCEVFEHSEVRKQIELLEHHSNFLTQVTYFLGIFMDLNSVNGQNTGIVKL